MKDQLSRTLALGAAALFLAACNESAQKSAPAKQTGEPAAKKEAGSGASPGQMPVGDASGKIRCFGVNECSGQSQCDMPDGRVAAGSKGHAARARTRARARGGCCSTRRTATRRAAPSYSAGGRQRARGETRASARVRS